MSLRILGLVPARGGSKGVPRKNLRLLNGRPLLQYTADAARRARSLSRIVLSTDDLEIADIGRRCGLEVPFLRPEALAQDSTPTLPVIQHALAYLEAAGDRFDAVCILQPTTPLRRPDDIDRCIQLLEETGADAVVTVLPVPPEHNPHWVYFRREDGRLELSTGEKAPISRRQDLPPAYRREGSVYVTRRDPIMERGTLFGDRLMGCVLDPADCIDINTPDEWERAERMVQVGRD
jgi:CMP-N-acetylneuraminic acid synthetase